MRWLRVCISVLNEPEAYHWKTYKIMKFTWKACWKFSHPQQSCARTSTSFNILWFWEYVFVLSRFVSLSLLLDIVRVELFRTFTMFSSLFIYLFFSIFFDIFVPFFIRNCTWYTEYTSLLNWCVYLFPGSGNGNGVEKLTFATLYTNIHGYFVAAT